MIKIKKQKILGRGGRGGGRGRFVGSRVRGGYRNFNSNNNRSKRQGLKSYPHGYGPDRQTVEFTKVKKHIILKIQSEFVNGSDISESIPKGYILYLSKQILIKMISTEDKTSKAES